MGDKGKQVADAAKQAAKQAAKKIKQAILRAIAPAIPYIAIAAVIIFIIIIIVGCFIDVGAEVDEGTAGMTSASSDTMEQITEFIAGWEGGGTVYKNSAGQDCYKVLSDGAGGYAIVGLDTRYYGSYFQSLGYSTAPGSLIPVDVVIAKKAEAIKEFYDGVEAKISAAGIELTQYQMAAVISRAFNCGVDGAFTYCDEELTSAYKKYWKQNRDDKYNKSTTADFSHKFYTNCMNKPVTSDGVYMAGLENRRKSEFTLFQCGYNTLTGEYFNVSTSSESEAANISDGGYNAIYTSRITGRKFKEFKQNADYSYPDISSVGCDWGSECGTVSTMIIGSGYKNITMQTGAQELINKNGATNFSTFLKDFTGKGLKYTSVSSVSDFANKLKSGCVAVIHNPGYSARGHYLAVLDISSDLKKIYISNPDVYNSPSNGATYEGWNDITKVYNAIDEIYFIEN